MKKNLCIDLTLAMVLSLAACGGGKGGSGDGAPRPCRRQRRRQDLQGAMICDSSISDGAGHGLLTTPWWNAAAKYGWEDRGSDSIAQFRLLREHRGLLATWGMTDLTPPATSTPTPSSAAEEYPNIAFALLNGGRRHPRQGLAQLQRHLPSARLPAVGWIAGIPGGPHDRDRQGGLHRRHGDSTPPRAVRRLRGVRRVRGPAGGADRGGPGRGLLR